MMLRSLFAVPLLAFSPQPAVPQTLVSQTILESIPLVDCDVAAGTAFRVGPNILVSVNHVTVNAGCSIDGQPERVTYASSKADFSMLADDREAHWLKVDCGGFIPGHEYIAVGHARGLESLIAVPMVATGQTQHGYQILLGIFTAQPGQSGGPIIDAETHEAVGLVNAANWEDGTTFSIELKDTPICGSKLA